MSRAPAIAPAEMPSRRWSKPAAAASGEALHAFYERYRRRVFSLIARIVGRAGRRGAGAGGLPARLSRPRQVPRRRAALDLDVPAGGQRGAVVRDADAGAAEARSRRGRARWRCRPRTRRRPIRGCARGSQRGAAPSCRPAIARCSCCTTSRGLQHEEIAEILGCRVGHVEVAAAQGARQDARPAREVRREVLRRDEAVGAGRRRSVATRKAARVRAHVDGCDGLPPGARPTSRR